MSRRRYVSTKISLDAKVNKLAMSAGDFAALVYTWMIPHAEDDCRLTGDPEELFMLVCPGRRDKSPDDVVAALTAMGELGLITWSRDPHDCYVEFPPKSFYAYQTYITDGKRRTPRNRAAEAGSAHGAEHQRKSAQISANQRTAPQNAEERRYPSPSPSPREISVEKENTNPTISFAADAAGADGAEPDSAQTPHGESGSGAQAQTGESAAAPPASCPKPAAALVRRVVRAAGATLPAKQVERLIGQHGELSEDRLIFEVGLAAEWIADPSRNKDKGARKRQMTVAFLHNWLKRAEVPRPPVTLVAANGARAAPNEPKPLPDVRGMSLKARPAAIPVTVEAS